MRHIQEQSLLNPSLAAESRVLAKSLAINPGILNKETKYLGPVPDLAAVVKFVNAINEKDIPANDKALNQIFDLINNIAGSTLDYFTRLTKLIIAKKERGPAVLQTLLNEGIELDTNTRLKASMNNCALTVELSTKEGSIVLQPDENHKSYKILVSDKENCNFDFDLVDQTCWKDDKSKNEFFYAYSDSAGIENSQLNNRNTAPNFTQEIPEELQEGGDINEAINELVLAQPES